MIFRTVSGYFDHNATTPVAPDVVEAVTRALSETYGNASSVHAYGQRAKAALDDARGAVAALIGAEPAEVDGDVLDAFRARHQHAALVIERLDGADPRPDPLRQPVRRQLDEDACLVTSGLGRDAARDERLGLRVGQRSCAESDAG